MKLLRKLFGAKNKPEPIKAAPIVVAEVKPPKPVITLDAVEQTDDEQELLKLASDGATSPLRQAAAEKIHSRELLEQLAKTAKTKDKNVFKLVKSKLDAFKAEDAKLAELEANALRICEKMERHIHQEADALFKAKLTALQTEWSALSQISATSIARYKTALTACEDKIAARAQAIADEEEKITLDEQALQLAQEAYQNLKAMAKDIYHAAHIDDIINANYEVKIQELGNAVRLAQMAQVMQVPDGNIQYLQDDQATGENIRAALKGLNEKVQDGGSPSLSRPKTRSAGVSTAGRSRTPKALMTCSISPC